jgi:hypothetical protein
MANLDTPFGMLPTGHIYPQNEYRITASYATNLFIGDPVVGVAAGTVSRATAGNGNAVIGAITGIRRGSGANRKAELYYQASSTDEWYATVADHPNQEFLMQEDSVGSDLALADRGSNVEITIGTGNTNTGRSAAEIDSSSTSTTSASSQLRIKRLDPAVDNAVGSHGNWVVIINKHQNGPGAVGAGI